MALKNRYAGSCGECGNRVAAQAGSLTGPPWVTWCAACMPPVAATTPQAPPSVSVRIVGDHAEIRLGGAHAGPIIFAAYRAATAAATPKNVGGAWHGECGLADLPSVLTALGAIEGLALDADQGVRDALTARAAADTEIRAAAESCLAATDVALAERGQALYPYQREGVQWLSVQEGALLADDMGLGKQQPIDSLVLTPTGWCPIGDLSVGDRVIGSGGTPTRIAGVFPQGVKPSYRVTFSDHSHVEAGPEHLWTIAYRRGGRQWAEMTLTTNDLMLRPKIGQLDLAKTKLYLPMLSSPATFADQAPPPVSPYLLGQLIANGSLAHGTPTLSTNTADWPSIKQSLLSDGTTLGAIHVYGSTTRASLPGMIPTIRDLGLNVLSREKHIPRIFFTAPIPDRLALLRGMMDGDGSISKTRCKVTYHTISNQLAIDVQELVECLGGIASVRWYDRSAEDKPVEYQVRIRMPRGAEPFRIPRKLDRYLPGNRAFPCRTVKSVEFVRDTESVCISVDADDHLYVTEHAILTHNTVQALLAAPADAPILVVSPAVAKGVWVREAAKWRPDLAAAALKGRKSFRWPTAGEMVVTNYDILSAEIDAAPAGVIVIADEAHAIKNPQAARTKKFRAVADAARAAGGRVWLLTATPLLGKPPELWALLAAIKRPQWSSFSAFAGDMGGTQEWIRTPRGSQKIWQWDGTPCSGVAEQLAPVMLRRHKKDVLTDLPAKTHRDIVVDTKRALRSMLDRTLKKWDAVAKPDKLPPFEALSAARLALAEAKIPAMLALVEDYEAAEEPVVVFSAHRAPIDALADRDGWEVITGDTSPERRTEIEARFQRGELRGIAATIQAGGVAITLTHASQAIFVDLDWTPALNAQAEDRIYRIGQSRGVLITRLIASHAIDERLLNVLGAKQDLITASVDRVKPAEAIEIDKLVAELDAAHAAWLADLDEALAAQAASDTAAAGLNAHHAERIEAAWQTEVAQRASNRAVDVGERSERRAAESAREKWASEALTALSASDTDHASEKNGVGFNKCDGRLGHLLARRLRDGLSDGEWTLASAICAKYWRQIGVMPEETEKR